MKSTFPHILNNFSYLFIHDLFELFLDEFTHHKRPIDRIYNDQVFPSILVLLGYCLCFTCVRCIMCARSSFRSARMFVLCVEHFMTNERPSCLLYQVVGPGNLSCVQFTRILATFFLSYFYETKPKLVAFLFFLVFIST